MGYQVFSIRAQTYEEACLKARMRYGNLARVTHQKDVRMGGLFGLFSRPAVEVSGFFPESSMRMETAPPVPQKKAAPVAAEGFEEEKKKILAATPLKQDETLKEVLSALRFLGEKIEGNGAAQKEAHPNLAKIRGLLHENDFSLSYTDKITERIKKEMPLEELENFEAVQNTVMDWIGESLRTYPLEKIRSSPVCILVGPTGVGKTTTIARLAALYGVLANERLDVRIITIDEYRLAAKDQLEKYGDVMKIPVVSAKDAKELKKYLALYSDVDMVLVDTTGRSPRDFATLGEMREHLDAAFKKATVHLVVCATTKNQDLLEIMQQFEPFSYESIIVTKLDETPRIGNVISAAAERGKAISFVTDGQDVVKSMKPARVTQILERLTGFPLRRNHIEEKFG